MDIELCSRWKLVVCPDLILTALRDLTEALSAISPERDAYIHIYIYVCYIYMYYIYPKEIAIEMRS